MAVMAVDAGAPVAVKERLEAFAGEVLAAAMNRPVQLVNGGLYLRGLLEEGARKSLEPIVERLGGDAQYQSMQQFLADSPWDPALVVKAVAERVAPVIDVEAWVLDDTGFPKDGKDSPGVKRQYSGTLGKTVTVRSACRCTRSVDEGRCRWDGRCICRRTGARMSSGGGRRRSPRRSLSRPSRSSGSSWWSAPTAGISRGRRCSAITLTARTRGCAIASIRPGASTCCRSGRPRRCSRKRRCSRCQPRRSRRIARIPSYTRTVRPSRSAV